MSDNPYSFPCVVIFTILGGALGQAHFRGWGPFLCAIGAGAVGLFVAWLLDYDYRRLMRGD